MMFIYINKTIIFSFINDTCLITPDTWHLGVEPAMTHPNKPLTLLKDIGIMTLSRDPI